MKLVPPRFHHRNATEVAVRNFKAHFLGVFAGTASNFSPLLWDMLLPQAEIKGNLLQQSNTTPNVSAYAHLNGPFDYNEMPILPRSTNKTDKGGAWAYHTVNGWYLVTSSEH